MSVFILQETFLISIAVIVFLIIRKLPEVEGFDMFENIKTKQNKISKFGNSLIEKLDKEFVKILEKILRRLKIIVMKLDNTVSRYLKTASDKSNVSETDSLKIFEDEIENNETPKENNKEENNKIEIDITEEKEVIKIIEKSAENDNIDNRNDG